MSALIIGSVAIAFFFISELAELSRANSRLNDSITYLNVALESSRCEVGRLQEILRKEMGLRNE